MEDLKNFITRIEKKLIIVCRYENGIYLGEYYLRSRSRGWVELIHKDTKELSACPVEQISVNYRVPQKDYGHGIKINCYPFKFINQLISWRYNLEFRLIRKRYGHLTVYSNKISDLYLRIFKTQPNWFVNSTKNYDVKTDWWKNQNTKDSK